MKDKNLPNDYNSLSLEELTKEANRMIVDLENQKDLENKNALKIGVLLPLSGKFEDIGQSFLKAIQLALYDISNQNINIFSSHHHLY